MKLIQMGKVIFLEGLTNFIDWLIEVEPGDPLPSQPGFEEAVSLFCFQQVLKGSPFEVKLREPTNASESAPRADLELSSSKLVLAAIRKAKEGGNG